MSTNTRERVVSRYWARFDSDEIEPIRKAINQRLSATLNTDTAVAQECSGLLSAIHCNTIDLCTDEALIFLGSFLFDPSELEEISV